MQVLIGEQWDEHFKLSSAGCEDRKRAGKATQPVETVCVSELIIYVSHSSPSVWASDSGTSLHPSFPSAWLHRCIRSCSSPRSVRSVSQADSAVAAVGAHAWCVFFNLHAFVALCPHLGVCAWLCARTSVQLAVRLRPSINHSHQDTLHALVFGLRQCFSLEYWRWS